MFPSFSGSARPKRQVNLSGRNTNPFAAQSPSGQHHTPNALAQAQQERIQRKQERERPPAAVKIQQSWRGHKARRTSQKQWREEWDSNEASAQTTDGNRGYDTEEQCLRQARLLVQFASSSPQDLRRLQHFANRWLATKPASMFSLQSEVWQYLLLRLAKILIKVLEPEVTGDTGTQIRPQQPMTIITSILELLQDVAAIIPQLLAHYSIEYYRMLSKAITGRFRDHSELLRGPLFVLLENAEKVSEATYHGFINEILITPDLPQIFHGLAVFDAVVDYVCLTKTLDKYLDVHSHVLLDLRSHEQWLWLLAYYIHFRQAWTRRKGTVGSSPDAKYVRIVSLLVSFLADDIASRIDSSPITISMTEDEGLRNASEPLPNFVQSELSNLVSQENVSGLLASLDVTSGHSISKGGMSHDASTLASYALILLRVFPRRGDEIRMWLYRGSTSTQLDRDGKAVPAVRYFSRAAKQTQVFQDVSKDPRAAVRLLRSESRWSDIRVPAQSESSSEINRQWRVIFLFLELYTFPLKIMDDEEFLSGSSVANNDSSWTRQSALPLEEVKQLTTFLKNLAFSLYWYSSEITNLDGDQSAPSLAEYFGKGKHSRTSDESKAKARDIALAGVHGLSPEYVKGLVTGVLRMIYERDSRRHFLPQNHWLMTMYFEMDQFISAVVREQEEKHKIEKSFDDSDVQAAETEEDVEVQHALVGTAHAQQVRNAERVRRQQQKASRRKYLESVTPRLEILQNMPFFIPFETRVEIFREFVLMDQIMRRGTANADEWRFAQANSPTGTISRHRAKVRRKNIFEDAFEEFYELGDGLKEPIQIRFVDEFDTIEEGIDGGGVTKEFLTSITNEAFGADNGLEPLFRSNDQNLLYPNPTTIEARKESLRRAMYKEGSPGWNENIRDLRRRYEFLGRIVGKCLYEGILIDVYFAPFFLLKWALTGGSGSAAKESGYRANLNDLRDLDERFYQSMLQLKNYPGDVEAFALDFTATDEVPISPSESKPVTRELRPDGASIPVTNENRPIYISYMARYRLQIQPHIQTSAFLQGLGAIISPSWLSMFNQSELQTLVSGTSTEVNVSDLRANTQYGGVFAIGDDGLEHPSIQLFWKVMGELSDVDKKKVLKFVTSTPRAPLLGFKNLLPSFTIRDSGGDQSRLPTTSTCVNLLKLPIFRDEATLKERLLYSVNSGAGFNLS